MIYVSIDIETTGLDPVRDDVLEIGAIVEDTSKKLPRVECPTFHCYVNKQTYSGNPFALHMNSKIFKRILDLNKPEYEMNITVKQSLGHSSVCLTDIIKYHTDGKSILAKPNDVARLFQNFLIENNISKMIPAGKNYQGFDRNFLNNLMGWSNIRAHHRSLDPGPLYVDFKTDLEPPDLKTCKQRAGLVENVSHEALDDAWDVITLLRKFY